MSCETEKKKNDDLSSKSVVKSITVWAICLLSILLFVSNEMLLMIIVSIVVGVVFGRCKKYGEWLEFKPLSNQKA